MGGPHRSSYANYVLLLRDNGDPAWSFRENGMYIAFYYSDEAIRCKSVNQKIAKNCDRKKMNMLCVICTLHIAFLNF